MPLKADKITWYHGSQRVNPFAANAAYEDWKNKKKPIYQNLTTILSK